MADRGLTTLTLSLNQGPGAIPETVQGANYSSHQGNRQTIRIQPVVKKLAVSVSTSNGGEKSRKHEDKTNSGKNEKGLSLATDVCLDPLYLMDLLAGRTGFSRGVYLRTGGGLDGHTPRAVGMDFLDRLSRLERIKYSRQRSMPDTMASKKTRKEHTLLTIPNVGYARLAASKASGLKPRDSNMSKISEKHKRSLSSDRDLRDQNKESEQLPNIPLEDSTIGLTKTSNKYLNMEDVIRALEYHNSTLERSKRHADNRMLLMGEESYGTSLPPTTTEVALRNARRHRQLERLITAPSIPAEYDDITHFEDTLKRSKTMFLQTDEPSNMPPKRSPLERAVRHNSVNYNHGLRNYIKRDSQHARARLQTLLIAHKVKRESQGEHAKNSAGWASRPISSNTSSSTVSLQNKAFRRSHTDVSGDFTRDLSQVLADGKDKSLQTEPRSALKSEAKGENNRADFVRKVTIILPSEAQDVDN